jgi:RND family efflux transporter MFP subunit
MIYLPSVGVPVDGVLKEMRVRLFEGFSKKSWMLALPLAGVMGCAKPAPPPPAAQAMPVAVQAVSLNSVPSTDTYVSTIKSRRSATMQPQVDGNITKILVKSGDAVKAGQLLMQIDPLKQIATVQSQQGTEQQQKAVYQYNQADVVRQKQLYEQGIISKQAYDQSVQSYQNSKGALDSASALTDTQKQQLAYYQIRAPFAGVVGDIPVHLGDYVSPTTLLTTVDENADLEVYIYLPTDRSGQAKLGLPVDLLDTSGAVLAHTNLYFLSPQVDNGLQGILAKAPVGKAGERLRNGQIVNARITWSTNQSPTVPVLAVTLIGGQTFVYVAAAKGSGYIAHQTSVMLKEPVGNVYPVISGLKTGDKVIVSGIQFLQEGAPVQPMEGGPPPAPAQAGS